eukprot:SAG11_NODE_205_length_12427_cov_8.010140_4_plen_91_part_00
MHLARKEDAATCVEPNLFDHFIAFHGTVPFLVSLGLTTETPRADWLTDGPDSQNLDSRSLFRRRALLTQKVSTDTNKHIRLFDQLCAPRW